jgi:hypothetical protein
VGGVSRVTEVLAQIHLPEAKIIDARQRGERRGASGRLEAVGVGLRTGLLMV